MSQIKIRGIVVKEVFVGEADKIITVIAKDWGKIKISAKGARRAKSKLVSCTSLFSYCDFVVYSSKNFNSLNQGDIIESFYSLTTELLSFSYGSYFAEVVERTVHENQSSNDVLLLFLRALKALKNGKIPPKLIARIFEIKFLQLNGVMPEIKYCSKCKSKDDIFYFTFEGVVCKKCREGETKYIKLTPTVIYTINFILSSQINNIFSFNIPKESVDILTKVSRLLFREHINIYFKTSGFIDEVEKDSKTS